MGDQAVTAADDSVPSVDQAGVPGEVELDEVAGGIGASCEQGPQNTSDGSGSRWRNGPSRSSQVSGRPTSATTGR